MKERRRLPTISEKFLNTEQALGKAMDENITNVPSPTLHMTVRRKKGPFPTKRLSTKPRNEKGQI